MADKTAAVIGGGPAGSMIALLLAQRGYRVEVYEKRPDFRKGESDAAEESSKQFGQSRDAIKRSINLALSVRGQSALAAAGVLDKVMASAVPMPCRAIHPKAGGVVTQPYGTDEQAIYSISRAVVNRVLLDACEEAASQPGKGSVTVHFNCTVKQYDAADGSLTVRFVNGESRTYTPHLVIGADGAYSKTRESLMRVCRADFARKFIAHGYKELTMPATAGGDFALPCPNALHIWPRVDFMLIALPNPDKSFTCTIFAPWATLDELDAHPERVPAFFEHYFPDALPHLPHLVEQARANPTSSLVETRLKPYTWAGRLALVGDAAHSTVPFYGQGMNAALEDCLVLAECIDQAAGDTAKGVTEYGRVREPAGQSLCDLSMGNYDEMKAKTASWAFLAQKRLEAVLHRLFPASWIPQYTMVAFTRIPYNEVVTRAARQEEILGTSVGLASVLGLIGAAALGIAALHKKGHALPIPQLSFKWV